MKNKIFLILLLINFTSCTNQTPIPTYCYANPATRSVKLYSSAQFLIASFYSIASLKKEGTYKYSKGITASGKEFKDEELTCAVNMFPLGTWLRVVNLANSKEVRVKVTDRISRRFARTRI